VHQSGRIAQPNHEPRRDARDGTARCKGRRFLVWVREGILSADHRVVGEPHYDHERQPRSPKDRPPGSSLTPEFQILLLSRIQSVSSNLLPPSGCKTLLFMRLRLRVSASFG
jgi:hypothetical protein